MEDQKPHSHPPLQIDPCIRSTLQRHPHFNYHTPIVRPALGAGDGPRVDPCGVDV